MASRSRAIVATCVTLSLAVCCASAGDDSTSHDTDTVKRIVKSWASARSTKRIYHVAVTATKTWNMGAGKKKDSVQTERSCPYSVDLLLDVSRSRYRLRVDTEVYHIDLKKTISEPFLEIVSGAYLKSARYQGQGPEQRFGPKPEKVQVGYGDLSVPFYVINDEVMPLVVGLGLVPDPIKVFDPTRMSSVEYPVTSYYVKGRAVERGEPCLVIGTRTSAHGGDNVRDYWVLETDGYPVVKIVDTAGGSVYRIVDLTYDKQTPGLLRAWVDTFFKKNGDPTKRLETTSVSVTIEADASDSVFDLILEPGVPVEAVEFGEQTQHNPSGVLRSTLYETNDFKASFEVLEAVKDQHAVGRSRRLTIYLIVGLGCTLIVILIIRRIIRRKRFLSAPEHDK